MVTWIGFGPRAVYVCEPVTVYLPPMGPEMTPSEVDVSPQFTDAVKSLAVAALLPSVNVASGTLVTARLVDPMFGLAVAASGASAIVTGSVALATVLLMSFSMMETTALTLPSSPYACMPVTVKGPPVGPVTMPGVAVVPSPQLMLAVNCPAVADGSSTE